MSEISQTPERPVYNPTILTIDPSSAQTDVFREAMRGRGSFEHTSNTQEAIKWMRGRKEPIEIVLLMTGRSERLGMPIGKFVEELKQISPDLVLALMTGGETGQQGVPTLDELREMGVNHVYEVVKYPPGLRGQIEFLDEVRTASLKQKLQGR